MKTENELILKSAAGELWVSFDEAVPRVDVRPTSGERAWRSSLLTLEILNRMEDRVVVAHDLRVMHTAVEEPYIHIVLRDIAHGITLGLWLGWDGDELTVIIPPAEIEEVKDELYRVHSVMVLPELMQAGASGNILLPLGSGALCKPADKPELRDRFLIYGEQERWELMPMLPISGVQTPAGEVVCLVRRGACDAWCAAETDGNGNGTLAMGAMFRRQWIDPVDWTEREFRYRFLEAKADLMHQAARRVRQHVIDDCGKPTLAERAGESPQCAYQQSAYTMKLFHGIQRQGIMMYGQENRPDELLYRRTMSFAQAESCLEKLQAAGVDRVYLQSVGWNPKGHDGAWPTCFPIDQRLGGEAGMRRMITTAKELDYQITTHLNFGMSCFASPDYNPDWVLHDIWGEPKVTGDWGGGIHSTHWGLALPDEFLFGRLNALRDLGCNGMQYLDFQGNPLYLNYNRTHRGPRSQFAAGIRRYQAAATKVFGGVQIEAGFLYCAPWVDAICAPYYHPFAPWQLPEDWPLARMVDRQVPLYQLALQGLVAQEQQGVDWKCAMNAVLFGRVMRDEWSAEPGGMPVLDDARIAKIKAVYDLATVRFGHLVTQELSQWEHLAEQVERTRFADGTEVVADFNEERLTVNGKEVVRPEALA